MGRKKGPHLDHWDQWFPRNLRDGLYQTSGATPDYNCIAWAAGDRYNWWEPARLDAFWPDEAPPDMAIASLEAVFAWLGYRRCRSRCVERGYEKVALYVNAKGEWTHAARQRPNGEWSSKLGRGHDVHHATARCLENEDPSDPDHYGRVHCYMKRRKSAGARFRATAP